MYRVKTAFGEYDVSVRAAKYRDNDNLAIELDTFTKEDWGEFWEPFARLTVNLGYELPENQAYVDINNCPWAEKFITENGLGKWTGEAASSGWCMYPLYEFNMEVIGK